MRIFLLALAIPAFANPADLAAKLPQTRAPEVIKEFNQLVNEGYKTLEAGDKEAAIELFKQQISLAPDSADGYYNLACAYARSGQGEESLESLSKAIDFGFESVGRMKADSDLASVAKLAKFEQLAKRADANRQAFSELLAEGLPDVKAAADIKDKEAYEAWHEQEKRLVRGNARLMTPSQFKLSNLAFASRRLGLMSHLKDDFPDFNPGLERIREIAKLGGRFGAWGGLARALKKEAHVFLATRPGASASDEANYELGMAAFYEFFPKNENHPKWANATTEAVSAFEAVSKESAFQGRIDAMMLRFRVGEGISAGVNDDLRAFTKKYRDDGKTIQFAAFLMQKEIIDAIWPIPIQAPDVNGEQISLDTFKGKVVLIDFWATWCGPCKAELPYMRAAYEKYKDKGFEILSISLDDVNVIDDKKFNRWTAKNKMNWRHIFDGKAFKSPMAKDYMIFGIPSPFLMGRNGELLASEDELRGDDLDKILAKTLN